MQKRAVCYPTCGFELSNRPFWTGMASDTRVLKDLRSAHSHFRAQPKLSLHSLPNLWNLLICKLNTFCHVGNIFTKSKVEQGSSKFCIREKWLDNATVLFGSKGPLLLLLLWSRHESLRKVQVLLRKKDAINADFTG